MEFMTGVKEKETLELSELLEEGRLGEEVFWNLTGIRRHRLRALFEE